MTEDNEDVNEEGFIVEAVGSGDLFAVFEDDGETGYLYVYEPNGRGIMNHLRVYVRSATVDVEEEDVAVEWSRDFSKCGVRIWGKLRGIINVQTKKEGRVLLEDRNTPGIGDPSWLDGF